MAYDLPQEPPEREPDFEHPPHELPSLYQRAMLLLCDTCGFWEVVQDVREGFKWRSDRTLPCQCYICEEGTIDVVDDDQPLVRRQAGDE